MMKRILLGILFMVGISSITLTAQTIKGKVTDAKGEPMIGASVLIKGTSKGMVTDLDGVFTFNDVPASSTLVVSFTGFTTQEVPATDNVTIILEEGSTLNEVVVVGYGTVKKSDLTGAMTSLKSKDMNPGANVSVDQMLQGRASGVQVTQSSSEPGGGLSIRIRGSSSVNASNEPLYVIDGFLIDNSANLSSSSNPNGPTGNSAQIGVSFNPRNPLNTINPSDIESIEILKDASATAIYGSRGANGVILITTKKGSKEKIAVNYSAYVGQQTNVKTWDLLSTAEYIKFQNDVQTEQGKAAVFSSADIAKIGAGTDWQSLIYRKAPITDHTLSLSGGTKNTSIYASLNYFDQRGIIKNTGIAKYIGRVNVETAISQKIRAGINVNSSFINDQNALDGVNTNENAGPIYAAISFDPTEPVYEADGSLHFSPNLTINNPLALINGVSSKNRTNRTMAGAYMTWEIIKGLSAKLNLGSDRTSSRRDVYNTRSTLRGSVAAGLADVASFDRNSYLGEYTMTYVKDINPNNSLTLLGGITYQKFQTKIFGAGLSGFPTDALGTGSLGLGDTNTDQLYSNQEENTLLSYLGRVNYNLMNKFLFTASLRADGSSRFGANNKYGYFPSFAVGYKLTQEKFIPKFFEELKVRASWGQTGNQEIGNYASQLTFGAGPGVVLNKTIQGTIIPQRIANPDLKWETTEQTNVGIDYSILKGRISGTIDYFQKKSKDLLFNLPLPLASGYSSILSNVGSVENKGFEFYITSVNLKKNDFRWSTSLNFSAIKNKVLDLGRITQIQTGSTQATDNTVIIRRGEPLASYYGYIVTGIFKSADEVASSAQKTSKPGFPRFKDINGDGVITTADQTVLGNPFPDFTYGVQNSFSYKNFQLDIFFQGQQGGDMLNINVIESLYPANFRRNRVREQILDRWTTSNPNAKWPSGADPNAYGGSKITSLVIEDATYLRLKNVQLSYRVPLTGKGVVNSLRLYVTGQNLWTKTNYSGFDPEANSFGRSSIRLDYSTYPLARTFIFGLNAGF